MLKARSGNAKRHIGACGVKPVSSIAKKNGPESLGAVARSRPSSLAGLEVELHAELHDSRVARRANLIEARRREARRRAANGVGVIESIKRLPTQLASKTLGELHVLEQREVGAPETGGSDGARPLGGFGGLRR